MYYYVYGSILCTLITVGSYSVRKTLMYGLFFRVLQCNEQNKKIGWENFHNFAVEANRQKITQRGTSPHPRGKCLIDGLYICIYTASDIGL